MWEEVRQKENESGGELVEWLRRLGSTGLIVGMVLVTIFGGFLLAYQDAPEEHLPVVVVRPTPTPSPARPTAPLPGWTSTPLPTRTTVPLPSWTPTSPPPSPTPSPAVKTPTATTTDTCANVDTHHNPDSALFAPYLVVALHRPARRHSVPSGCPPRHQP